MCSLLAGVKQNGSVLNDVILPPWAKGDPNEFIRLHREVIIFDMLPREAVAGANMVIVHELRITVELLLSGQVGTLHYPQLGGDPALPTTRRGPCTTHN